MKLLKKILIDKMEKSFNDSYLFVNTLIIAYVKSRNLNTISILDIGCQKGKTTEIYLKGLSNLTVYGLDAIEKGGMKGTIYSKIDLENDKFPYKNSFFDIVLCGQTIEHILNKDHVIEECKRVLRPNGLFICATENISSFDNILSLMLGQEPIVQQSGNKFRTESILSPHFMSKVDSLDGCKYGHKNVSSYFSLSRLCSVNGFSDLHIKSFGNIFWLFEKLMPIYNRVLVVYSFNKSK